jgi:hypothetical protein
MDRPTGAVPGGPFEPSFEAIQQNVFTPTCALSSCHGASMAATLDLREGASYDMLVDIESVEVAGVDRVEPFLPDDSYLICKLENCAWIVGQPMPLIGGPLPQDQTDVIRDWISMGAPEFPTIAVEGESWGRVKAMYR